MGGRACGVWFKPRKQLPSSQISRTHRGRGVRTAAISNHHYGSQGCFSGEDGGTFGVSGCVPSEQRQMGSSSEEAKCHSASSPLAGREYIVALIQNNKLYTLLHHKEC